MEHKEHQMIPIWFFIGLLLAAYGVLITASGLYHWKNPPQNISMSHAHADVWWGALMLVLGLFYVIKFHPGKVEEGAKEEEAAAVTTRFE